MSRNRPRSTRRPITFASLMEALATTGHDAINAAAVLGCTPCSIRRHAEAQGLTIVPRAIGGRSETPRTVFTDEAIAAALTQANGDVDEASRILGCGPFTVYSYRSRAGLPKRAPKSFQPWTPERIEQLQELAWQTPRPAIYDIAQAMGTTISGIQTALSRYGVTNPKRGGTVRQRGCMVCSRPFMSEGAHHRQCPRCYSMNCEVA